MNIRIRFFVGILILMLSVVSCSKEDDVKTVGHENIPEISEKETDTVPEEKTELKVRDDYFKQVGYAKINSARITDMTKFRMSITGEEVENHIPQRFFDIVIVFESAKILPANSPKLRGETKEGAADYVLAYKEWKASEEFSPSAAALNRADLYTSDGRHIDDPDQKHNDPGRYSLEMHEELKQDILDLKATGTTVLMDIMPDHEDAGWLSFKTREQARKFAMQINEAINEYQWDGIDIDEEYAEYGTSHEGAMTRVLYELRKIWESEDGRHPGKKLIIAKALWADYADFSTEITAGGKKVKLADMLDDGWEMSYGGSPDYRLNSYLNFGMTKEQLGLGVDFVWVNDVSNALKTANYVKDNEFRYMMYYDVRHEDLEKYQEISKIFYERDLEFMDEY